MKFNFTHNSDGSTVCEAIVNGIPYRGIAKLNPKDKDFQSNKIGEEIAHARLMIKLLKQKRNELNIRLHTIKNFYSNYKHSKSFVRNCLAEMSSYEFALDFVKKLIEDQEAELKEYIKTKDEFHQKLNRLRSDKTDEETVAET